MDQVGTCWGGRISSSEKATSAFVLVYVEPDPGSAVVVPVEEMVAFEEVLSSSLSDRMVSLAEAVAAGSEFRQCFASSRQRGLEGPGYAGEAQREVPPHPTVARVGHLRHFDMLGGERLVASGHCAD